LVTRSDIRLAQANTPVNERSPEWLALRDRVLAEEDAERKRLWYVAATRAEDLLVVSGIPHGAFTATQRPTAAMLLEAVPAIATAEDGSVLSYTGADGAVHAARVHVVHEDAAPVPAAASARADTPADYATVEIGDP